MPHMTPTPGEAAPGITVERLGADSFDLARAAIDKNLILLFYRGVHCPACRAMLEELNGSLGKFSDMGIEVVPVSMDSLERAERQLAEWDIGNLAIGYGMSEAEARSFGLFISEKVVDKEPDRFSEPGLFVLGPGRTIEAMFLQSVPFTRPSFDGLLGGIAFVREHGRPPRGTVPG